ncbi:HD-GYP domain, c-di-GMP phosphodiesterase class II (or its inactivated variant) [Lachnospiraceae bacterium C7]|nr:HD-GYP domain, c-di-GMP phosphodiesterase class II (or its inactivated variant) [Lachnospiraceae bacterium C7]
MQLYIKGITDILMACAIVIMSINVYKFSRFMFKSVDVLAINQFKDFILEHVAVFLLIAFDLAYISVFLSHKANLVIALVFLGGAIFVTVVLLLLLGYVEKVKESSLAISEALIGVIEARDPNLNGHSVSVRNITMLFYQYLPLHIKAKINPVSLEYAALLHDVGKLGIPEFILNKPGKLTEEEYEIMKLHPRIGVQILAPLKNFDIVKEWIEYHHERIDGRGYYNLKGEDIPLPAKIIAIADTYSAITMRRSYKEPRTHDDAIKIISEVAGTQLDKELVEIFVTIPRQQLIDCTPENVSK